ncbi:cupin domain-containing protein [Streptomyces longispororuber]|uniref:cupin domain-containing protein n=1 Tax=Streptomyces longispororuber TaxID=68230 RepID=UPI00167D04FE|nr:hypothetical protein [Streptomyces longispororuber]
MPETPRLLLSLDELVPSASSARGGALWKLAERRRQLDANLIRLPASGSVALHVENALDVLLVVVAGDGHLDGDDASLPLTTGSVAWLPRSSRRGLRAGSDGLVYLTVHTRRPGMGIAGPAAAAEGGEAPCALDRVCPHCGTMRAEARAPFCAWCGERQDPNADR